MNVVKVEVASLVSSVAQWGERVRLCSFLCTVEKIRPRLWPSLVRGGVSVCAGHASPCMPCGSHVVLRRQLS